MPRQIASCGKGRWGANVPPAEWAERRNPGYCFKRAGWRQCGITKVNKLVILEKEAANHEN